MRAVSTMNYRYHMVWWSSGPAH